MVVGQETQQVTTILGAGTEATERGWQTQQSLTQHLPKKQRSRCGIWCRNLPGGFLFFTLLFSSLHKVLTYLSSECSTEMAPEVD